MNFRLESWIENNLPKNKKEFSRDAVEILLTQLWKECTKTTKSDYEREKEDEAYGRGWY